MEGGKIFQRLQGISLIMLLLLWNEKTWNS